MYRLLTLCCILLPLFAPAQTQPDCDQMLRDGDALMARREPPLEEALRCYLNALNCNSQLAGVVGPKVQGVFEAIKRQQESEQKARKQAVLATQQAREEADHARREQAKAEQLFRTTYANDLAYKSQTALRDGDRTTAFRLAEFAHRYVETDNPNVTQSLMEALYYNDNPAHPPLPWASNLVGHTDAVYSLAFSPDGLTLATGSEDHTAKIWDLQTGKVTHTLRGHTARVWSVTFSPDGKSLATASVDKTAKIWDLQSGKATHTLQDTAAVSSVAFSPDGKSLATGSMGKTAKIWDLQSGKATHALQDTAGVLRVAFSPDGKSLATGSWDHTKIWDLQTGQATCTLQYTATLWSVAFSPDGKSIATASLDSTAKIWDLHSGKAIQILQGHTSHVLSVAFSPDGKSLATTSLDLTAKIWDLYSGKATQTLQGHSSAVLCVAFSPDGRFLATGSLDHTAKIWDLQTGQATQTFQGHTAHVWRVAFSSDGKSLATSSDDHTAKIWDLHSGKATQTLQGHTARICSVAFSPDRKSLATGSDDQTAKIWDLQSGQATKTLQGHTDEVESVAFSPDGKSLATGSRDQTAKIWDLQSGQATKTLQGHTDEVESVAFSPDGKSLATGSWDHTAKIWDLQTGKATQTLQGHTDAVLSVAFSPDGKYLATASWDHTAKIWALQTGKTTQTLQGHTDAVSSVAFSPDGKSLATGSWDLTAKIWDLQSGQTTQTLQGHAARVTSVAFSPDDESLATASWDLTAKIWDLDADTLIERARRVFTDSSHSQVLRQRRLATLTLAQLSAYHLENLLDLSEGVTVSHRLTATSNEAKLIATGEVWQIDAFAELYAQNTRNSQQLARTARDYARAARLYWAAFHAGGDSLLMARLGRLYQNWAQDILVSARPDTALHYAQLAQQLLPDDEDIKKTLNRARIVGQHIETESDPELLAALGDNFYERENWRQAAQAYEKAEKTKHDFHTLVNWYESAEEAGLGFDFQRFLNSEDLEELNQYAAFFTQKAEKFKANRDKVPNYQNALRIRERQLLFDTAATTRAVVANEYVSLGFYQLFVPDGKGAEASIRRSIALDPSNKYAYTNIAPALLLQGRYEEAKTEYLNWAPKPFNEQFPTYRDAFLADFKAFRDANVLLPHMDEIEALLKALDIKPDPPH